MAFSEDGFDALSTLRHLRTLDLSRCIGPSFGDFGPVLSKLEQLTDLDLSFCDLVRVRACVLLPLSCSANPHLYGW